MLVGIVANGCSSAVRPGQGRWVLVAAAAARLLATEKVPALLALLPLLAVTAIRTPRRTALVGAAVLVAVAALSTLPYLYYSDGTSWSAYGGDRYSHARPPTMGGRRPGIVLPDGDRRGDHCLVRVAAGHPPPRRDRVRRRQLRDRSAHRCPDVPPRRPALVLATVVARPWRRRTRATSDEPDAGIDRWLSPSAAPGLAAYAAFYVVLFTDNHYGGMQSIGSRYFLQLSPLAVVVPVAGGLRARMAVGCAAFAALWALLVLGPNLWHADTAFADPSRVSWVQGLLPLDGSQVGYWQREPG